MTGTSSTGGEMGSGHMKRTIRMASTCALVILLAGCPRPGGPNSVANILNENDYPLQAAGFHRDQIINYDEIAGVESPGAALSDVSVGYNMLTPETQIASTIYITHAPTVFPDLLDQRDPVRVVYEWHKSAISKRHPGAELRGETTETMTKSGNVYTVRVAAYRYEDKFMGKRQTVYSVLLVWRHGENIVKLRSTAPYAQGQQLRLHNLRLLDAVNWTVFPMLGDGQVVDGPWHLAPLLVARSWPESTRRPSA